MGDSVVGEVVRGTVSEVSPSCSSSSSSSLSASSPAGTLTCQHTQPCHCQPGMVSDFHLVIGVVAFAPAV
jgi:hypothetical protein